MNPELANQEFQSTLRDSDFLPHRIPSDKSLGYSRIVPSGRRPSSLPGRDPSFFSKNVPTPGDGPQAVSPLQKCRHSGVRRRLAALERGTAAETYRFLIN